RGGADSGVSTRHFEADRGHEFLAERAGECVETPRNGSRADRDRAELHVAARLQARFALGHRVADIDHETVIGRFVGFRERTLQQGVEVTHESGSNSRLSFSVPLRTCDFTVPRGRPVISTISEWLSPSPWFSVT